MSVLFKALEKAARQNAAAQETAAGAEGSAAGWTHASAAGSGRGRGRAVIRVLGVLFLAATAAVLAAMTVYSDEVERLLADAVSVPVAPAAPAVPPAPAASQAPVVVVTPPADVTPPATVDEAPQPVTVAAVIDPAPPPVPAVPMTTSASAPQPEASDGSAPATVTPAPAGPASAEEAVDPDDDIALLMQEGATRRGPSPEAVANEPTVPAVTPPVIAARPERVTMEEAFGIRQAATDGLQVTAPAVIGRDSGATGVGGVSVSTLPMETQTTLAEAYAALVRGNHGAALDAYAAVAAREPDNLAALAGRAAALHKLQRLDEARAAYEQVLARQPDHREALTNMIALIGDSAPRDAIHRLEALQAQAPDFSPVPAQLGMLHARLGDVDRAAAALRRAIALSPDNALYHYNLAVVSDRAGRRAEAAQAYEQVLRLIAAGPAAGLDPRPIQERLAFLRAGR